MKSEFTVLRFGSRSLPRMLRSLRCHDIDVAASVDEAVATAKRVVVIGDDADLATVVSRLLRTERLDTEVAHVTGSLSARRAVGAAAQRVPLIRDDSGTVLIGSAQWLPPAGSDTLHGEAVVDDAVLFDGDVAGVRIEPTTTMPGLRARVMGGGWVSGHGERWVGGHSGRWVSGRAAQLGTTGVQVVRDGVPAPRELKRSTFYRHTTGWLKVL